MFVDKRYFRYFDWFSFAITILLLVIGLLFVFSATYQPSKPYSIFFKKQVFGIVSGFVIYFFFCIFDLRRISRWGFIAYMIVLFLLAYTMIGGMVGLGAKRWLSLYFIKFQPSEPTKLFFPLCIAYFLGEIELLTYSDTKYLPIRKFVFPIILLVLSFILILKQPDLGTALVLLFSALIIFWFIGISKEFFLTIALVSVLCAPFFWSVLKPYQQKRVLVLFGYGDIKKERYQIEQSQIAIGSGGLSGKGFLHGTQNKLNFLPEDHTDFIFSVICEELGFLGAFFILLLFSLLFIRNILIIGGTASLFEQIIGIGLLIHIILSLCVNLGMVTGLLPIVGIPLPLVSYGLSNLWTTLASLGGLNNIAIRRFYY